MIEMYVTKQTTVKEKMVNHLERVDSICDDCWINMFSPTEDELHLVEATVGVPSEFLRYPLDEEERPRIDTDDDTGDVLILIDIPYVRREGQTVRYETAPLGIIIAKHHILTVSLREANIFDQFTNNRVRDFVVNYRTRFAIQILFAGAKDYLKLLRYMDKTLDSSERELAKSISNKDLYKHLELGKSLIYFSTSLKSNEAVLEKLMRGRVVKQYEDDEDLLEDVIIEYRQARDMLSESDPTIGESLPEMSADPTPIPSQQQTAVTIYETETQASESAATTTSASETTTTTTTSSSETTTTDITTATDSTITTDATATDETTAADTTTAADATTTTTPATTTTAP